MYFVNYITLMIILLLVFVISLIVFFLSFLFFYQTVNDEKNSIYECGFVPFGDARNKFDVKFYLVSILFVVFDLEVAFLLPCVISTNKIEFLGLFTTFIFLILVALGFMYE